MPSLKSQQNGRKNVSVAMAKITPERANETCMGFDEHISYD